RDAPGADERPSAVAHRHAMKPLFHPSLIHPPFGDPGVFIDALFARQAFLFDLGDLSPLPPRKLLRVSHAFVSHTHLDHFIGFDQLLRLSLGRDKRLHLFGPAGFVDQVWHRLNGYSWNLVENYVTDFTIAATELHPDGKLLTTEFHCRSAFRCANDTVTHAPAGLLLDEETFTVRAACLDHDIPCLAFALEEKCHVNFMRNRLIELDLPVGPWLTEVRRAVLRGDPDERQFSVPLQRGESEAERILSLGELKREVLTVVRGQKIGYVTDVLFSPENARRIEELVRGADYLFIETPFLHEDMERARSRYHLTARQAGMLARRSAAERVIPFHFSPRNLGREACLRQELADVLTCSDLKEKQEPEKRGQDQ
ncbi:MAG TPA: MBL fold metallo-hydrolase, partial [Geobacteraceae bacterium]